MKWWIRCRVLKVGTQELYRGQCVYLFNHRSWGDFIVDQYVTEGRSLFMSRCRALAVVCGGGLGTRVVRCRYSAVDAWWCLRERHQPWGVWRPGVKGVGSSAATRLLPTLCRLAVLGVFPTFVSALVVLKSIILFKRGSVADKEVKQNEKHCFPA